MSPRRINLQLRACAVLFAAGAVASLALALALPLRSDQSTDALAAGAAEKESAAAHVRPLSDFEAAWNAPLRQSLADLPPSPDRPAAVAEGASQGMNPPLALVGTIGQSLAMLQRPDGVITVHGIGEHASGLEIVAIRTAEIDVRVNGQLSTLRKPPDRTAPR